MDEGHLTIEDILNAVAAASFSPSQWCDFETGLVIFMHLSLPSPLYLFITPTQPYNARSSLELIPVSVSAVMHHSSDQ